MDKHNNNSFTEFILQSFSTVRFPVLLAILFLLIFLVILTVNIVLMLLIKVDTNLHTPMYFFIFHLSFMDICYTSCVVPQILVNLLSIKHSISLFRCASQMFCIVFFGAIQVFLVTAMAYDRYAAISNPLGYQTIMSWEICRMIFWIICIVSFLISFTMVISVFLLPFCNLFTIDHFMCDVGQVLLLTCPSIEIHNLVDLTTYLLALCMFTIPFLLILISYMYIISAILKIRTNEGRRKAFSTCSSHLTVVIVEYACLGFLYFRPKTDYTMDKKKITVVVFLFTSPILNPVIYSIRNKDIKKSFIKLYSRVTL